MSCTDKDKKALSRLESRYTLLGGSVAHKTQY